MFNTTPSNQINIDPVLTRDQLPSLGINYSKVTLLRLERAGKFPQRFYLTQRRPGWRQSTILAWLSGREAVTTAPSLACNADGAKPTKTKRKKTAK